MSKHSATAPFVVNEPSLSRAWAQAFLHIIDNSGKEITPLVLSITGFRDNGGAVEDDALRRALDELLTLKKMQSIEDVAYTIFPDRLWQMSGGDRGKLFEYYRLAFPRYQAMNRKLNGRGLYFERLTSYNKDAPCGGNQLEWIISQHNNRSGVRRSMFQATTFDPVRDHRPSSQLGFPCLQHATFEPTDDGLVANAFYATQLILKKGYGNFLGLARLAAFMAHEMGMPLARLNVMVGIEKLDEIPKTDASMNPVIVAARTCTAPPSSDKAIAIHSPRMDLETTT